MTPEREKFFASLPKKRVAAMGIIRDQTGKILIVKPTYRPGWLLPGGIAEEHESPKDCCLRELAEELGMKIRVIRLLVVDYKTSTDKYTEGLYFVFDCGRLSPAKIRKIKLPAKELSDYRFVTLPETKKLLVPALARRLINYPEVIKTGQTLYLEDGTKEG